MTTSSRLASRARRAEGARAQASSVHMHLIATGGTEINEMTSYLRRPLALAAALAAGVALVGSHPLPTGSAPANLAWQRSRGVAEIPKRMSFHNRVLLNRAAVTGLRTLEVMLLVVPGRIDPVSALVGRLGGRVARVDSRIGYMRVDVPTEKLLDLVASRGIETYQISSLSRGKWYRDGPPEREADALRGSEVSPAVGTQRELDLPDLPALSVEASHDSGYTADRESGIDRWRREHPTFDGRGTTIALLESALPDFGALIGSTAMTLDGRPVPKLAGILNPLDPDAPDETRVRLDVPVDAVSTWTRIDDRTYILPRAGTYRFGVFTLSAGSNLAYGFAILEDEESGDVLVDTDGDASFQDEAPIADVNERLDVQFLRLKYPREMALSFVMAHGRVPHSVHIYCGRAAHQTMTLSVAAGNRSGDRLSSGVAPGARILLVRSRSDRMRFVDFVEAYLEATRRGEVDIVSDSTGLSAAPDTSDAFLPTLFSRLTRTYAKPLFHAAGNEQLIMGIAHAPGASFSVGGSIGPDTFAAFYGGGRLDDVIVHPTSTAGPSVDGAIKPDFLAPMHRLATGLPWSAPFAVPKNQPTHLVGPGYQISCCTSASSPYAAGVAALLLSGVRQMHASSSQVSFARAMRIGARFLPGVPSYEQGNGVLDVNAAWRELTHGVDAPRITSSAEIVHPLAPYARHGSRGQGIFEMTGWRAGMAARREITLTRESGPAQPIIYRLGWTGNDGSFAAPTSVTLPLETPVVVPIAITLAAPGVHSALLDVREPAADRIVYRMQATIVASVPFDTSSGGLRLSGVVPLMRMQTHVLDVPAGVSAMRIDLRVLRGTVRPAIVPSHTLAPGSFQHVTPGIGPELGWGSYTIVLANPVPGPWTINLTNNAARRRSEPVVASDAEYLIAVSLLRASLHPRLTEDGALTVDIDNQGARLQAPVVEVSRATVTSHAGTFSPSGLPNIDELTVPRGAFALTLRARSTTPAGGRIELYLYDCTTGECFLYNFTLPAMAEQTLTVRHPKPGRWLAAVNPAPFPGARGSFVLDEIVATGTPVRARVTHRASARGRPAWTTTIPAGRVMAAGGQALLLELIDEAAEREAETHRWEHRPNIPRPNDRAVAGWTVFPIE